MKTNDIKVMLQDYEAYGSLGLNWHSFGSNNREIEPESNISTYEAYTKRALSVAPVEVIVVATEEVTMGATGLAVA